MIQATRDNFNLHFSEEKYRNFLAGIEREFPGLLRFRIAESPVFLSADFAQKLRDAGEDILKTILRPDFKSITEKAIPAQWRVAHENDYPHFLALDFAVSQNEQQEWVPKLIELQGFPTLFGFQYFLEEQYKQAYAMPDDYSIYFSGLNKTSYLDLLKRTILGPHQPEEVVLMDINAPEQKTMIDFRATQQLLQIPILSFGDLKSSGQQLYYEREGQKIRIKRIYNRLIFDELETVPHWENQYVDIRKDFDVEWISHPNWFYRISKYLLPFLKSEAVPETHFLHSIASIPADLENYVLKPLFSFAGQGVIIDVKKEDLSKIKDPENWILQKKVAYMPAIASPRGHVKCEIRLMYLWPNGDQKPTLATNLVRLSRGKMIGVRYNENFDWVGSTVAFMKSNQ